MIAAAVFLLSAACIAFEILLTRVFAISQWNHLAFMVISMALFGFAASGTFLSMSGRTGMAATASSHQRRINTHLLLFTVTTPACFLVIKSLPLDYLRLPVEPLQGLYLLTACLVIAVPFFHTGMVLSSAYISLPHRTGAVYVANMAGSAVGALVPMALLPAMDIGNLIALTAVVPLVAVPLTTGSRRDGRPMRGPMAAGILNAVLVLFLVTAVPTLFRVEPSAYKSLSQLLLLPDTSATLVRADLRGSVTTVNSRYIRFAPGLSLKFAGALPQQQAAFIDGNHRLVLAASHGQSSLAYQRHTLAFAGYLMPPAVRNVLIVQNSGGSAVACALSAGAEHIQVLENNPVFSDLLRARYGIRVSTENARAFLRNRDAVYDVIHVESWGASLPGAAALDQDYSLTVDALRLYLAHLADQGVIVASRRLLLPPANLLRLCAAACEALAACSIDTPERHIAVIRNWDTFTMILSRHPLDAVSTLFRQAEALNFDLVWPQGDDTPPPNRFNTFEKPFHAMAVQRLFHAYASGHQDRFFDAYPLDVVPQGDARPFPDKFFKWRKAGQIHRMTGSRLYALLLSGEIVVAAVLAVALLTSAGLLCLPIFSPGTGGRRQLRGIRVYFIAAGVGFLFVELFFIQHFTLVFGSPVVAFSAVLAALLVFTGTGGLLAQRLGPGHIRPCLSVLAVMLCLLCLVCDKILHWIVTLPTPYSQLASILLILPPGILLGIPFPLGMQHLAVLPGQKAHAWALNGCASVVSSVAAVQLTIASGLNTLMWVAAAAYGLAWLVVKPK